MPTKPFSLQSPEQIAKDYGGNKQKIAQAAQSGLLDPTAAVMAGMFIDRMRSAQTQEQGPPTTVAQQVFAPPPPPPPPQGGQPPMMGQPGMAPPMAPPMGAPPVGMAAGGLTTLPLPDNMFDEPDGMGYANGGLVAFAKGGEADEEDELTLGDRLREQFRGPEDPTYYGRPMTAADMRGAFGIPEPVKVKPELPTLGDRLREQFRGPEDPTYYGRPMTARDMRGTFGIPEPKKEGPPPAKSKPSMPGSRGVFYVNGAFVDAGGEPVSPPKPGAKVPIGAQRLIGGGIVPSGRSYTVPTNDPAYRGLPVSAGDMRKTFGNPEGYVPFGGEGTGISRLLGGLGDESFAAKEFQKATAQYYRDRAAYDAIRDRNARIAAIGGGKPQPLPPKPVMPKQSDFKAAPKAKPATPAAKPATPAAKPAAKPAAGILDLSGGQSRESVPRGTLYRDPQGNIRRNDNGDKGNPIVTPPPPRPAPAAGPRVAGPAAPTGPRVAGPAPAGPRLAAGPALPASPAAPAAPGGAPFTLGGMSEDPAANIAALKALAPQDTTMRDTMAKRYADMSSPEALAAQKKQDFWGSLAQIGFGMAGSNSPYFLQAAGQAASAALPGMQQARKERKAQELAGLQGQLGIETTRNQEASALAKYGQELAAQVASGRMTKENADRAYNLAVRQLDAEIAQRAESNDIQRAGLAQRGSRSSGALTAAQLATLRARTLAEVRETSRQDTRYGKLRKSNPAAAEQYLQNIADARIGYLLGGGGGDGFDVQE